MSRKSLCEDCTKNANCDYLKVSTGVVLNCNHYKENVKKEEESKSNTGGAGNIYWDIPDGATQLQDLIEHKNMNGNVKDVFKACYRLNEKDGTDNVYDVEKMAYYSLRELGRILNTKDYISLAVKLIGSQSIKDKTNG